MMDNVSVGGVDISLSPLERKELRGVLVDDIARYTFYHAQVSEINFILLVSKTNEKETPLACEKSSARLKEVFGAPVVYLFDSLKFYERIRYIEKRVFFISSDNNAFLPGLILSFKPKVEKKVKKLSASAQYLLLYHLQKKSLNGMSILEISEIIPDYSYVSIAKAVEVLELLGLCKSVKENGRNKVIHFVAEHLSLWDLSKPYLISPVKEIKYCDTIPNTRFQYSGTTALSKFSELAPDDDQTISIYAKSFDEECVPGLNDFDGVVIVEIRRYPFIDNTSNTVDKLSLYLSLENNEDPRISKENKIMFDKIWQNK